MHPFAEILSRYGRPAVSGPPPPPQGILFSSLGLGGGSAFNVGVGTTVLIDMNTPSLGYTDIFGTVKDFGNFTFTTTGIHVENGGALQYGLEGAPTTAGIQLNGAYVPLSGNGVVLGAGVGTNVTNPGTSRAILCDPAGRLDLHGIRPTTPWTTLNAHAAAGDTNLVCAVNAGWRAGDPILVAPSDFIEYGGPELLTLASNQSSAAITTTTGLAVKKWGLLQYPIDTPINGSGMSLTQGVFTVKRATALTPNVLDQRSRVINMQSSLKIFCPADSDWTNKGHGVTIMAMASGTSSANAVFPICRIEGVQLRRGGNRGALKRYPMHFHLLGYDGATGIPLGDPPAGTCYFKNNVVWDSENRAYTVHGTTGVEVSDNVSYNVKGHALFMEDGSELRCKFLRNMMLQTIPPNFGTQGGTISSMVGNGTTVTVTLAAPNASLYSGMTVDVYNASISTYNLYRAPITVIDSTHFTYAASGSGSATGAAWWWGDDLIKRHDSSPAGMWLTNFQNQFDSNFSCTASIAFWLSFSKKVFGASSLAMAPTIFPVTGISLNGTTATVTVNSGNQFANSWFTGDKVYLSGWSVAGINGVHAITSVGFDQFTFASSSTGVPTGGQLYVPIIPDSWPQPQNVAEPFTKCTGFSCYNRGIFMNNPALDEEGTVASGTGRKFGQPSGISFRSTFHVIYKNTLGAYSNSVGIPIYIGWTTADNGGSDFQGSTNPGGDSHSHLAIGTSLNNEHAAPTPQAVFNLTGDTGYPRAFFATYHGTIKFHDFTSVNFPFVAADIHSSRDRGFSGGTTEGGHDFYDSPGVDFTNGLNTNIKYINSHPGNMIPTIPFDGRGDASRHFSQTPVWWDTKGDYGVPGCFMLPLGPSAGVCDPFFTFGAQSLADGPVGNTTCCKTTTTRWFGCGAADSLSWTLAWSSLPVNGNLTNNILGDCNPWSLRRIDPSTGSQVGLTFQVPRGDTSWGLNGFRPGAVASGGYFLWEFAEEFRVNFTSGSANISTSTDRENNGFVAGAAVVFKGSVPTGITAGQRYFVLSSGLSSTNIQVAATAGGTAIVPTSTVSGSLCRFEIDHPTSLLNVQLSFANQNGDWCVLGLPFDTTAVPSPRVCMGANFTGEGGTFATAADVAANRAIIPNKLASAGSFAANLQAVGADTSGATYWIDTTNKVVWVRWTGGRASNFRGSTTVATVTNAGTPMNGQSTPYLIDIQWINIKA
jgi:hypothetical protein